MLSNKNSKIYINRKDRPSDFMLDLASMAKEQEEIVLEQKKNANILTKGQYKLKGVFKKEKKIESEDLDNNTDLNYEDKEFESQEIYKNDADLARESRVSIAIDQLALFRAIKTIISVFEQLIVFAKTVCFKLGWSVVFLLRFIYFLIIGFFKLIANPVTSFFSFNSRRNSGNRERGAQEKGCGQTTPLFAQDIMDPELFAEINDTIENPVEETNHNDRSLIFQNTSGAVQETCSAYNNNYSHFEERISSEALRSKGGFFSFKFRANVSHFRTAVYFAVFMFALILPFKAFTYYGVFQDLGGKVLGVSENAIGDFKNAGTAAGDFDFYKAGEQFAEASDGFLQAQAEIDSISSQLRLLSFVIPNDKLALAADAEYILEAGSLSAKIGQQISFIFDTFSYEKDKSIKTIFSTFFDNMEPLQETANSLHQVLLKIDSENLPADKQVAFEVLRGKTGQIRSSFIELSDLLDKMRIFLGFDDEKRYLLIFQNNSEMRASGGFMGSFAIVDFRDGEIINIETPKGGTYDTEGAFLDHIVAPRPLHIVNPSWHFWDANWWPDWKKTSRKLKWFYENSGGSSVDGVIGMTPIVVERLLEIMGPLNMEDSHGVTITAENFWEVTQTFAEQKPSDHPAYEPLPFEPNIEGGVIADLEELGAVENELDPGLAPKKIIGDLIDEIKNELPKRLDKDIFLQLATSFEQSLSEKHVLFYFDDYILQNKFEELGWAGRTKKTAWDYLMVVNSNISGAKSDRKIEQEINHQSELLGDGTIVNTLRITRTHTGVKGEKFTGVKNLNWMRIYLPLGSQFIEASGFWPPDESLFEEPDPSWRHDPDLKNSEENFVRDSNSWTKIYNEDDKTVFANWVQVDPGKSVEVVIKYTLPFKLDLGDDKAHPFALLVEKQPGAEPSKFSSHLILSEKAKITWQYPSTLETQTNGWFIEDQLSKDKFWAVLVK